MDDAIRWWCATEVDPDTKEVIESKWKHCETEENGGNDGGRPCVFPFVYKGQTFNTCINKGAKDYWCATTRNYDKDGKWSWCADTKYGGNGNGQPCVFPFTYKSWTFYTCSNEDDPLGRFWCATTGDYDKDHKWSYCADTQYGGNANGQPCVFPFTYKSWTFYTCSNEDDPLGRFWCATTGDYDKDQKWSYCAETHRLSTRPTGPCVFPFIYKGKSYMSCTTDGESEGKLWCSLTSNYDEDQKWIYCTVIFQPNSDNLFNRYNSMGKMQAFITSSMSANHNYSMCNMVVKAVAVGGLSTRPTGPCVFPFIYKGKSYMSCTTDGESEIKLWCSLTSNYDEDQKWTYCDLSEPLPCKFPFIYNKKSYSACTRDGAGDNTLWCSTTDNYDRDSKWKACAIQEYGGNSNGQPCVFPFAYKDRTFYTCTNEDDPRGSFWCATTGSYDKLQKWSYCADTRLSTKPTGPCVFPFIYKGKSYTSCTTDGESDGKLWCSLTSNYDEDPKWTYCDPSVDQHLHTPMYFFLMNLSCLETCYISTIVPRMLASFFNGDRSISIKGCITQYYFFGFCAATECYLLALMSYDRYLAICKPLHYSTIMNGRLCLYHPNVKISEKENRRERERERNIWEMLLYAITQLRFPRSSIVNVLLF
nr:uncharacterized protein LOC118094646 [Zootoca vivipara]